MDEIELRAKLWDELATIVALPVSEIDPDVPLREYGLDSVLANTFVSRLERLLQRKLDVLMLFEHPTIARLATFLARGGGKP